MFQKSSPNIASISSSLAANRAKAMRPGLMFFSWCRCDILKRLGGLLITASLPYPFVEVRSARWRRVLFDILNVHETSVSSEMTENGILET